MIYCGDDDINMNKIIETMLGHIPNNVSLVIITPLPSTFNKLSKRINIVEYYDSGFFENYMFKTTNNKIGMLILSPQGIAAKDVIELFSDTTILFFGMAGCVNNKYKIGDLVQVKEAMDKYKNNTKLHTTEKYPKVNCGYSPCLVGKIAQEHCEIARKNNCDVVDMETTYCAQTAVEKNNKLTALLLISDIPDTINFWELSDVQKKELKSGREKAIDEIIIHVNFL